MTRERFRGGYQSLVTVLERWAPTEIAELRRRHVAAASLLSSSRELGEAQDAGSAAPVSGDGTVLLDLARASLAPLRARVDRLLEHVLRRMTLASRIRLFGAVAAAASGLVAALLVYTGSEKGTQLATACFSFVGGLVTVLADRVIQAPSGLPIASSDVYTKILAMRLDIERMALRLARAVPTPLSESDLADILNRLDEIALDLIRYERS
ncbi:hypothetical protein AA309_05425 [Microvirga vignae]|uniref:SMODS and SLOG-associating 2TM effector domain-containing protein n=1 Tax=Microvirga vignae TaxID=1225564 RepID=A0A0H1RFF6_9HYPH|nr:hypothetical protein [Microvirga vignae]KLK93925.1 hypothetical protein AA309_05425 [Microvirga vignae]